MESDLPSGLYRDITGYAHATPPWARQLAELWTEAGLLLFGALFVVAWWRARHGDARAMAVAVLAPLATAVAYVCSESLKSVVDEERPCRAVAGAVASLVPCPPVGDWSFPSNHATIAGAAAVALVLALPRPKPGPGAETGPGPGAETGPRPRLRPRAPLTGLVLGPLALLMAFSRVFVGVHYPHDVAVGLLLGAAVALAVVRGGTRPAALLAAAMRTSRSPVVLWLAGPGAVPEHMPGPRP
ncbi:phosphatase PAP2 family protein [Streptomyces sp. FIT100]|uniref:phosphatase PAP2 family protein n=1 Tax=Streptomyces sp. FIT100 TaxID=2837956 RepID=UPI0021C8FDD0|nr:phosphatase PAP2 family protein [Streptomyces sp. FIT100]UUN28416.1 phosphatase PAP2 family protein [Streptomyces sp. FIT100]